MNPTHQQGEKSSLKKWTSKFCLRYLPVLLREKRWPIASSGMMGLSVKKNVVDESQNEQEEEPLEENHEIKQSTQLAGVVE
ncbi:MAG TPA: hypothetical protein VFN35_30340 [Ktedonobacteraceae bacterium]|nr:hypothetical protein [Ktedonobacteraceae bacterium]